MNTHIKGKLVKSPPTPNLPKPEQAKTKSFMIVKEIPPLVWRRQIQVQNCRVLSRAVEQVITDSSKEYENYVNSNLDFFNYPEYPLTQLVRDPL